LAEWLIGQSLRLICPLSPLIAVLPTAASRE